MTKTKVLVSPGFGAGWSTWNSDAKYELATDDELIRLFEAGDRNAFEARAKWREPSRPSIWLERLQEIETAAWRPSGKFPGGAA